MRYLVFAVEWDESVPETSGCDCMCHYTASLTVNGKVVASSDPHTEYIPDEDAAEEWAIGKLRSLFEKAEG